MAGVLLRNPAHANGLHEPGPNQRPVVYDHTGKPYKFESTPQGGTHRYDDYAIPHIVTFSGIIRGAYRTYFHRMWDEAQKADREDALAMRRDAFLMGLMQERKLAACSLKWHLTVDDEYDRNQLKVKDHLTKCLKATPRLQQLIYYLLDAVWYGRYGSQLIWKWKDIDSIRSLCIGRHLPVNGDKIGHTLDHCPYIQVASGETDEQLLGDPEVISTTEQRAVVLRGSWRERFIIHTHEVDDADYLDPEGAEAIHGVGVRHRVYWLDWLRREYISWLVDFLERVGLGVTLYYYDASNPNSKAEAERAAHEQNRRSVILWPYYPGQEGKGGSVQRVETPTNGAAVLLQLQQHIEDVIERYVIGQTLSSGTEGSGLGGTGVAMLHMQTKANIIAWDANNLAETLTTDVVDVMRRWIYGNRADFPVRFEFAIADPSPESKIGLAAQLYNMQVPIKAQEVRSMAGFSDPEPDDEVILMPDPQGMGQGQPGAEGQQDPQAQIAQAMGLGGQPGEEGGEGGGGEGDPEFERLLAGAAAGQGAQQMRRWARAVRYGRKAVADA